MRFRRLIKNLSIVTATALSVGCATSKIVGHNVALVAQGQSTDSTGLGEAWRSDAQDMEKGYQIVKKKAAEAYAVLHANVQKRWGQGDSKVADKTVYVKYTQGYKSRVVTDFDHGTLTVETLEESQPEESLKTAIVAALLTSNNPATVDLFSDREVVLDADHKPYLYNLVLDQAGKPIATREQAQKFAAFLVPAKMLMRPVSGEQGGTKTSRYVKVMMVKNFEVRGAERYRATVDKYSDKWRVSPSLVMAVIRTESNFNPFAVSAAPAYGMMQLVPSSGGREAYKRVTGLDQVPTPEYLFDPDHSIELGAAYLSVLDGVEFKAVNNQDSRDYCVIAAYNTGAGNVTRTFSKDHKAALVAINLLDSPSLYEKLHTQLPFEETRTYVARVTSYRRQFVTVATANSNSPPAPASKPR
jgi:membrane-bound lytic murein transglycosylase C